MKQKKGKVRFCVAVALLLTALLASSLLTGSGGGQTESIKTVMRDAVLHEENRIASSAFWRSTPRSSPISC